MYPSEIGKATRRTPRMDRQIERTLKILGQSAMTVAQLAEALHLSHHSAGTYIRLLYNSKPKRIYISDWLPTKGNKPTRIYSAGSLKDVKYTSRRLRSVDTRKSDSKAVLIDLLVLPQSVKQLAERSGTGRSSVGNLIAELRAEGKVYIKAWVLPKLCGSQSPVYALGNLPDAVRVRARRKPKHATRRNAKPMVKNVFATIRQQPGPECADRRYEHLPDGPVRIFRPAA